MTELREEKQEEERGDRKLVRLRDELKDDEEAEIIGGDNTHQPKR